MAHLLWLSFVTQSSLSKQANGVKRFFGEEGILWFWGWELEEASPFINPQEER
ncbi:MAG: hypothetical protein PVH19_12490 [Planctomycetia bacterium]|jgi:hypothetical protein